MLSFIHFFLLTHTHSLTTFLHSLLIYYTCVIVVWQISRQVFGYRPSDSVPCGPDGTPTWQMNAQAHQQVQQPLMSSLQQVQYQQHHIQQQPQMVQPPRPQY